MARDSVARSSARRSATRVSRRGRPGAAGAKVLEDTGADVFRSDEMRVDEDEDVSVKRRASSASPVIPVSLRSQGLLEGVMERHDLLLFNDVYQPFRLRGHRMGVAPEDMARLTRTRASTKRQTEVDRMPLYTCADLLGRDKILKRLAKLVFERNESQIKLYGPEGSGKTSVAVEFVDQYKEEFPGGMVWLNGSFMVWDVHRFLVEDLHQHELTDQLALDDLRENLWRYLFENEERWLLVIDDATEDALEWVPPPRLSNGKGVVLITSKAKSGRDEALRVELPLLSAKSTEDLMRRAAGKRTRNSIARTEGIRREDRALLQLSDQAHLCRSVLSMRVAGYLVRTYDITFEELLERYDTLVSQTIMPDLNAILNRYKLKGHHTALRNIGVIDTADFLRGRPWTALKNLSTKETYQFEKIQENLFRSRNRLSLKLLCKIWRDLLKDPEESRGRHFWEMLRVCSFFNAMYIPAELIVAEMAAHGFTETLMPQSSIEDLMYRANDGTICVHPTLLEAVRSIHEKSTESNRSCARRVLTSLHAYCMENVFPLHRGVAAADPNMLQAVMAMLPHLFMAVGMCRELLENQLKEEVSGGLHGPSAEASQSRWNRVRSSRRGLSLSTSNARFSRQGGSMVEEAENDNDEEEEELPEDDAILERSQSRVGSSRSSQSSTQDDFQLMRLYRRHSLFSVASGASSVAARSPRSSLSAGSVSGSGSDMANAPGDLPSPKSLSGAFAPGGAASLTSPKPILRSLTRRFTHKSKRHSNASLLLADLTAMQAFMLLLIPLGDFRLKRAQSFAQEALNVYQALNERSSESAMHYILGHVHFKCGRLTQASDQWMEADVLSADVTAKSYAKGALALSLAEQGNFHPAMSLLGDALGLLDGNDLVSARTLAISGYVNGIAGNLEESRAAFKQSSQALEDVSPMSLVSAETHGLVAVAALQTGDSNDALFHAEEALMVFTNAQTQGEHHVARVYMNLGAIYEAQQEFSQAAQSIRYSVEHSDKLFETLVPSEVNIARERALADALARAGRRDEASDILNQVRKMTRNMRTWSNMYKQYTSRRKSSRMSSSTSSTSS